MNVQRVLLCVSLAALLVEAPATPEAKGIPDPSLFPGIHSLIWGYDSKDDHVLIGTDETSRQPDGDISQHSGGGAVEVRELTPVDMNPPTSGRKDEVRTRVTEPCDDLQFARPRTYRVSEGDDVIIKCSFTVYPKNCRFLCRGDCSEFLFSTSWIGRRNNKYVIEFGDLTYFNVTITQLTASDSGWYRCGALRDHAKNMCQEFEIVVQEGSWVLSLCVPMAVVLLAFLLLLFYKLKMRKRAHCENNARQRRPGGGHRQEPASSSSSSAQALTFTYENWTSDPRDEEPVYQRLDPVPEGWDQTYCTLRP